MSRIVDSPDDAENIKRHFFIVNPVFQIVRIPRLRFDANCATHVDFDRLLALRLIYVLVGHLSLPHGRDFINE